MQEYSIHAPPNTMNSVLHRAIELNNLGAAHLNTQNLRGAIWTLREGLMYLQHNTSASNEQNQPTSDFLGDSTLSSHLGAEPFWIPVKRIEQDPTILPGSTCVTVRAYSFGHPLLLEDNTNNVPTNPDHLLCVMHQISAVTLFNLALAHHWMGMRLARIELHRSAVRLYHTAHNLVQAMEESLGQPTPPPLMLLLLPPAPEYIRYRFPLILKLLAMNNMAQICYDELGDYQQMTVAVSAMQRLMTIVDDECSGLPFFRHHHNITTSVLLSAHHRLVSEEDAASLMINARMLQEPCTAGAA